jgi:myo-inositol 2-dehydrogenase / D-chiro-inositol 1-dehydrogenase
VTLQVGVIGAGLMGTTHVRVLSTSVAGAQVAAVSDAIANSARRLADEVGVERVFTDALELIGDPAIDAVIVASPGETHEQFVVACLEAGKPVLCQKPLATTAQAARRVLDAEAALGRRLVQVGFMRRFDPGYADMKRAIDAGRIGAPVLAHSVHRNPSVPARFDSEMIIKDTCVHDVDTVRFLLGQELVKATAYAGRPSSLAPKGVRDPQVIVLETDAGALVTVEAFVNAQYAYDIRCEVVGETGTLSLAPPATVEVRREGHIGADVPMGFQDRFGAAFVAEQQSWVASIADGRPTGASAWDGYAAAAVCEAAYESLLSDRPVEVRLGTKPELYGAGELVGQGR